MKFMASMQRNMARAVDCSQPADWSNELGWDVEYQQVSRGNFEAWFSISKSDRLLFTNQFCNRRLIIRGCPGEEMIALVLPVDNARLGIFQGIEFDESDALILLPGDERSLTTPDNMRACTIGIPYRIFETFLYQYDQKHLAQLLRRGRPLPLPPALIRFFTDAVTTFMATEKNLPMCTGVSECEERILETMAEAVSFLHEDPVDRSSRLVNRRRYVRFAEDYIEAHLRDVIRFSTVAEKLNITTRTLRLAFHEVLGVSPAHYLRSRRLKQVRQQLIEDKGKQRTIARLANENGFYHLGNFARDYKNLFGELPSQTAASRKSFR